MHKISETWKSVKSCGGCILLWFWSRNENRIQWHYQESEYRTGPVVKSYCLSKERIPWSIMESNIARFHFSILMQNKQLYCLQSVDTVLLSHLFAVAVNETSKAELYPFWQTKWMTLLKKRCGVGSHPLPNGILRLLSKHWALGNMYWLTGRSVCHNVKHSQNGFF
jgi:hypothetical protein